jgi:hypothetical protein
LALDLQAAHLKWVAQALDDQRREGACVHESTWLIITTIMPHMDDIVNHIDPQ